MNLGWYFVLGAIVGWAAGDFMKDDGFGWFGDIVVGIVGAFIGVYPAHLAGLNLGRSLASSVIIAFLGAVVLTLVMRILSRAFGWGRRLGS